MCRENCRVLRARRKNLSATDRETIGNMGTELGATTTIFPSDENTRAYLEAQGRRRVELSCSADEGADYDEHDEIDLSVLEPLIAKPNSPGNVVSVREIAGLKVDQVIVGSSVNSSFQRLDGRRQDTRRPSRFGVDFRSRQSGEQAGYRECCVPRGDSML